MSQGKTHAAGAAFFSKDVSRAYDQRNSGLAPIAKHMHFLTGVILRELPEEARILCVGVGTGAEILALAAENPRWQFVGVDPSAAMLEVCAERLAAANLSARCDLIQGTVDDVAKGEGFDAVLAMLVGHFIAREDRTDFYRAMFERVKAGGYLVNTELSFDLNSAAFPHVLYGWKGVQELMGATPEMLHALPEMMREHLCVLPPAAVEDHMRAGGVPVPAQFLQSLMIAGWFGVKGH